nr:kinetochore and Eb1-associated basic protein [Drosophila takahashii]
MPLRSKDLLEVMRSSRVNPKKGYLTPQNGQGTKNPKSPIPAILITDGDTGLERPHQLLQRLETLFRSSSASRIPSKNRFLTPQNRQRTWERPKTPEFRSSKKGIPFSEPRPLRSKELREKSHLGTSACKITSQSNLENQDLLKTSEKRTCTFVPSSAPQPIRTSVILERERQEAISNRLVAASIDRQKTKATTTSFTSSRLLVPQIGFSYPKDPKSLQSLHAPSKATKLTNSKRKLDFHPELSKDSLRRKLDEMAREWQKKTEYQLRQFISDFVSQLVRLLPSNGVQFSHLSRNCHVQQMAEALQQLRYSKKVNKSWLRTPNTRQAMGHVLEILYFLLDNVENRKGEGLCTIPIVSEEKAELKEPKVEHGTPNDIMSLPLKLDNLKIENATPVSNDMDKIKNRIGDEEFFRQLDSQEESLHNHHLHLLRLQEFSELVNLAKIKLKRCYKGNKESIDDFNEQIRDLADCLVFKNRHMSSQSQLHLNPNPTEKDILERMEQLQLLYEDNYLNLAQLSIKPPQGSL